MAPNTANSLMTFIHRQRTIIKAYQKGLDKRGQSPQTFVAHNVSQCFPVLPYGKHYFQRQLLSPRSKICFCSPIEVIFRSFRVTGQHYEVVFLSKLTCLFYCNFLLSLFNNPKKKKLNFVVTSMATCFAANN